MKKAYIVYQIYSLIVFIMAIAGLCIDCFSKNLTFSLFHIFGTAQMFYIFLTLEILFLVFYSIYEKKYKKLLISGILIAPLICSYLYHIYNYPDSMYITKFDNLDNEVIIKNESVLLSGESNIYLVKNIFVLEYVDTIGGDDGFCPLEKEEYYEVITYNNIIEIRYSFFGGEKDSVAKYKVESGKMIQTK